ncbi:futalosine hydrolase [Streptomyces sp. NPDC101160]|uniref:futalosine hydrolase n=1 Tax=Streptomyces sp. NPDC101160 TaxID=3366118 RepID=UPI00382334CA
MTPHILVVTAVAAEADSVAAGLDRPEAGQTGQTRETGKTEVPLPGGFVLRRHGNVDVLAAGVGPAAAAVAAATALTASASAPTYDLVVSAGIAGGFQPLAPLGSVVVSDAVVAADLGAQTPDGYLAVEELGFGRSVHRVAKPLTDRIAAALPDAVVGPILTVSTVTGTAGRAAELAERHPGAVAEAMEGFGVAEAAAAHGVPVVEIRAVSNAVGPRDRAAWRIGEALAALQSAFRQLSRTAFVELPSCPS